MSKYDDRFDDTSHAMQASLTFRHSGMRVTSFSTTTFRSRSHSTRPDPLVANVYYQILALSHCGSQKVVPSTDHGISRKPSWLSDQPYWEGHTRSHTGRRDMMRFRDSVCFITVAGFDSNNICRDNSRRTQPIHKTSRGG